MKQKVALAFSGGLDTSFCVKYLNLEKDLEVHSVFINSGGFSKQEEEIIETGQGRWVWQHIYA